MHFSQVANSINGIIYNIMKLGRYRERSKPVAICDRSALFGFMKLDSAEIVMNEEAGVKEK